MRIVGYGDTSADIRACGDYSSRTHYGSGGYDSARFYDRASSHIGACGHQRPCPNCGAHGHYGADSGQAFRDPKHGVAGDRQIRSAPDVDVTTPNIGD